MNLRVLLPLFTLTTFPAWADFKAPIDERWILAEDKQEFLDSLTPGTDDHFFFKALHQQNQGDRNAFLKTIQEWKNFSKKNRSRLPIQSQQLVNRQTMLDFEAGEAGAEKEITNLFRLHKKYRDTKAADTLSFPNTLTDKLLSEAMNQQLGLKNSNRIIGVSTMANLHRLIAKGRQWSKQDRDTLLSKVTRADIPNLDALIHANFKEPKPLSLQSIAASKNLSTTQLNALKKTFPKLLNDRYYIDLYIASIRPDDFSQFPRNPELHLQWLDKLDSFTQALPEASNSLKAHVLYHLLKLSSEADKYPTEAFTRFMQLPRYHSPIWARSTTAVRNPIVLSQDHSKLSACAPIGSENALIERYLDKLLTDSNQSKKLARYFDKHYFSKRIATAQLLAGTPASSTETRLSAADFESLRAKKELNIAASTPNNWQKSDAVSLKLDLKNIDTLTVSIYALDTLRYAKETGTEITKDIDLSSLSPNSSRTIDTKKSPFLRHRHVLELPELSNVGSWMVELHGNGQRATALIHKGEIHHSTRDTGSGQEVFITDFSGTPLEGVIAIIDSKEYTTDESGTIQLPYSAFPTRSKAYLHLASKDRKNGLTRVIDFTRKSATPTLDLSVISHPEQWIANHKATFYFKPTFLINGKPGQLDKIRKTKATLTGTLLDGTQMQLASESIKLTTDDYLPVSFTVPANLASLQLQFSAELLPMLGKKNLQLRATRSLAVTPAPKEQAIAHSYFYQNEGDWEFLCLGRNGEPRPKQPFSLHISHELYKRPIIVRLMSDDAGKVYLGKLPNITKINIRPSGGTVPESNLDLSQENKPLHLKNFYSQTDAIKVFLDQAPTLNKLHYTLTRKDGSNTNYFSRLSLQGGTLEISNLQTGRYQLTVQGYQPHSFEVLKPTMHGAWAVQPGEAIELDQQALPQFSSATVNDGKVIIKLTDHSPHTRLHLVGSHFSESSQSYQPNTPQPAAQVHQKFGFYPTVYGNGGTLSEEYQYITKRRSEAPKLGNMLERPAWHLNPWSTTSSNSTEINLDKGSATAPGNKGFGGKDFAKKRNEGSQQQATSSAPIAFLKNPSVVLSNLTPNKDGFVTVDLSKLGDSKRVDVILTDANHADSLQRSLVDSQPQTRDLRLTKSLDSTIHYMATETHAQLADGASAKIENILDADWKAYGSLADAFSYFHTHAVDQKFRESLNNFTPALTWPTLNQEQRLKLLKNAASHELHLFISQHDPTWFKEHLVPQLENKRRKTFIDHYLLEHDLSHYASPGKYHQLNTVEKALLGQRLQSNAIAQHLQSIYTKNKPSNEANTALFTSLLRQGFGSDLDSFKPLTARVDTRRTIELKGSLGSLSFDNSGVRRAPSKKNRSRTSATISDLAENVASDEFEDSFADSIELEESALAAPASAPAMLKKENALVDPGSMAHETKAYVEGNYIKRQHTAGRMEIPVNRFWVDLASWDGKTPFLSPHFAECQMSVHEALVALAFLDLPFESIAPEVQIENNTMSITAKQPMVLYYRDIRSTPAAEPDASLLSSLRYFRSGDHFSTDVNGKKTENAITGDFKTKTLYEAHLVITNPSGIEREIDILRQIPAGAIRTDASDSLSSMRTTIQPHGTWTNTTHFYFPEAGKFTHYPPQIHQEGKPMTALPEKELNVVTTLPIKHSDSWTKITAEGSDVEVLEALGKHPLHSLDPKRLARRMESKAFYTAATKILRERMIDESYFAPYALQHGDKTALKGFLNNPSVSMNKFGSYFKSALLETTPYHNYSFEDTEWRPLINERSFPIAGKNRITNQKVWGDYLTLLSHLIWKKQLGDEERLTLAYHLFLHDRNKEAVQLIDSCKRESTDAKMQFDYLTCYRHFLDGNTQQAAEVAKQWEESAHTPWKERFALVTQQAEQHAKSALLDANGANSNGDKKWAASLSPLNVLRIDHKNIEELEVQVYPVDLEFLFSSTPFLKSQKSNYKAIRPLQTLKVKLDPSKGHTELALPEIFQTGDRLLVIDDGEQEWLQPIQSTQLKVVSNNKDGLLQTSAEGKPLSHCYIKVYGLTHDHRTVFYKDGHTDLRGMFDYRSHNIHAPNSMQKYAVFINHPERGSITTIIHNNQ